jgi:hypothetical protein
VDPHQSDKLDPDWHQSDKTRIRINLQMTSQKVRNISLHEHFFTVLSLYLEARIRIRIKMTKQDPSAAA